MTQGVVVQALPQCTCVRPVIRGSLGEDSPPFKKRVRYQQVVEKLKGVTGNRISLHGISYYGVHRNSKEQMTCKSGWQVDQMGLETNEEDELDWIVECMLLF